MENEMNTTPAAEEKTSMADYEAELEASQAANSYQSAMAVDAQLFFRGTGVAAVFDEGNAFNLFNFADELSCDSVCGLEIISPQFDLYGIAGAATHHHTGFGAPSYSSAGDAVKVFAEQESDLLVGAFAFAS